MTESRPTPEEVIQVLHLHAQRTWHDEAYIVANRAALVTLKSRIEVALQQGQACGTFVPIDGEEFHLHILLDDANWQSESWQRRALPYTDEVASTAPVDRRFPEEDVLRWACVEETDDVTDEDHNDVMIAQRARGYNEGGLHKIAPTIGSCSYQNNNHLIAETRIRRLTPREVWRLMGREDWEFDRAREAGVSDSQLYKQGGNALIPQIVAAIAGIIDNRNE